MKKKVKILGLQFEPAISNKVTNYQKVSKMLRENSDFEPDLVILPELWNTGLDYENTEKISEPLPDASMMFLSGFAEKYNTNIIGGSIIEKDKQGKLKNTCLIFDRKGALINKYQKIHLFSHFESSENKFLTEGSELCVADFDFGKVGVGICYDLRFPELARKLAINGAEMLIFPSAWASERKEDFELLTKARALENLAFVGFINQTGKAVNVENAGHSLFANPKGQIIANLNEKEGVLKVEIDLSEITTIREEKPFLKDIKLI